MNKTKLEKMNAIVRMIFGDGFQEMRKEKNIEK